MTINISTNVSSLVKSSESLFYHSMTLLFSLLLYWETMTKQPNLANAFKDICAQGDYLPENRETTQLHGITFEHPKGQRDITIDSETLHTQGRIYVGHQALRQELQVQGFTATGLAEAGSVIESHYGNDALIWGFSGFASVLPGIDYRQEGKGIAQFYDYLATTDRKPGLAVDGGVSAGNLGLSAVIAAQHGVPTMGFIPLNGLDSTGTRDHLVVWGNNYPDREVLVGTTPDAVLGIGGAEGTRRECEAALKQGSAVLLMALKDYGPKSLPATYQKHPVMTEAVEDGRMVICESPEALPDAIEQTAEAAQHARDNRSHRLKAIREVLGIMNSSQR